jgi:hypothetical protein
MGFQFFIKKVENAFGEYKRFPIFATPSGK